MSAYLDAMRHYADFQGRATRSQFWLFTLVYAVILCAGLAIDLAIIGDGDPESPAVIAGLVYLAHIIPSLAILVRRLHDIDYSGWWALAAFTGIGAIVLLIFACLPSTGPNRFGTSASSPTRPQQQPHLHPAYVPTVPAPAAAANLPDLERLERLAKLKDAGALDAAEFEKMKAELLNRPAKS